MEFELHSSVTFSRATVITDIADNYGSTMYRLDDDDFIALMTLFNLISSQFFLLIYSIHR